MKKRISVALVILLTALLTNIFGGSIAYAALTDGLVGWYKFSEGSGTVLHDFTPNAFHGTITSAPWSTGPVNGYSLLFNGVNGDATLPQNAINTIGNLSQGSISIWFYYPGIPEANAISPIYYMGDETFSNFLVIEVGHNDPTNEKLYFTLYANGGLILCFDSGTNLTRNTWYHFVGVVGVGGNTGFLNGTAMTQRHYNAGDASTVKFFSDIPNKQKYYIGYGTTSPTKSNSKFYTFNGKVGETRIYNRPLSASEVQAIYNLK